MRELVIKPEGSTALKVLNREVRKDHRGEYVLWSGMHCYLIRKDGRAYIDYYMTKENAAKPAA